jgi:F-type H+-transporting ATPase subunit a
MGDSTTWFDYLYHFEWFSELSSWLKYNLGREPGTARAWAAPGLDEAYFTLTHVFIALVVSSIVFWGGLKFFRAVRGGGESAIVPPKRFSGRAAFELLTDAIFSTMVTVMGEKNAKRFLPFIGAFAIFILLSNIFALVPGFAAATDTLKTNAVLALTVFFATHYFGVREHGLPYFKHFLGPVWWLSPLMLPIEIISHLARPLALAMRLTAAMAADHKVIFVFFGLVPLLVPVPFLVLGLLISILQAFVFSLLSMVYISMAVSHDH